MGARVSLAAGLIAVAVGSAVGTTLGLLAGDYNGWWARVIMQLRDVLLAVGIAAIRGGGMVNVIVAVAVYLTPTFACHILPGTLTTVMAFFTMRIGTSIITAACLSFLTVPAFNQRGDGLRNTPDTALETLR